MKLLYFAWLKDAVGRGEETVDPPGDVATAAALADWLSGRSEGHAAALADRGVVRVAINQEFAAWTDPVGPGDEVAFFPPVTGG